jgi:hypothetical protein
MAPPIQAEECVAEYLNIHHGTEYVLPFSSHHALQGIFISSSSFFFLFSSSTFTSISPARVDHSTDNRTDPFSACAV